MSTNYYRVREGYSIEPYALGKGQFWHVRLNETGEVVASIRADHIGLVADYDEKAAHRSGGTVRVYATGPDSEWVLSEYGEPVTLGDLRRGVAP